MILIRRKLQKSIKNYKLMKIKRGPFGKTNNGEKVELFTLSNDNQVSITLMNYGGIVTSVNMPDKNGKVENIICGFNKLEDYTSEKYLTDCPYFGALIGRYGNRIAKGVYNIDGNKYNGVINNGENHLHGGIKGFDKKVWEAETFEKNGKVGVSLSYLSIDGEEGYPGNLKVYVRYCLDNQNRFTIKYEAETDKTTVVNFTNHTYFNLSAQKKDILNHELEMPLAKNITESVDLIPTGKLIPVKGTAYDFTSKKKIGKDLPSPDGYDTNFVLDNPEGKLLLATILSESESGRSIKVYTTQPGIQIYTGYYIPEFTIDGNKKYGKYTGVAMETQHYPDSPNHPEFPSTLLKPGEKYSQTTQWKIG